MVLRYVITEKGFKRMLKLDQLFELSTYLQVVIGCGFIAYLVAMHGRRREEKAVDVLFGVVAFGLPVMVLWHGLIKIGFPEWAGIILSIAYSFFLGVIWRKWVKKLFYKAMYDAGVSTDEGYKSTWQRIIQDVDIEPKQIFVTLKDGKVLSCEHIGRFKGAAIELSSIDDDGNIAIYVTHIDGKEVKAKLRDEKWGDLITYIPATEVYTVGFRCLKK